MSQDRPNIVLVMSDQHNRRLEIEVKAPDGRQSEDQVNFQRMIERFGGMYVLAWSVQDVHRALESAEGRNDR